MLLSLIQKIHAKKMPRVIQKLTKKFSSLPLALKLSFAFSLLIGLTLTIFWLVLAQHLGQLVHRQSDSFGQAMTQQMADAATEPLLAEDAFNLRVLVNKVTQASIIQDAYITNSRGKWIAASSKHPLSDYLSHQSLSSTSYKVYSAPIIFQKVHVGLAHLVIDEHLIEATLRKSMLWMSVATLLFLILSILLATFLAHHITEPIKRLKFANEQIRQGNLDHRIQQNRQDEMGVLMESFNIMAEELKEKQKIRTTFNRYFDPHVADNILTNSSGPLIPTQYVEASVLFVDMVNFTAMCEQLSPEQVACLLNIYYTLIQRASSFYHGTLDKFIGDGAMIIFGVPIPRAHHSFHAVCCGQLILGLVEQLNQYRCTQQLPTLEFRLGLHCGSMLAGSLGDEERLQYTVVGDSVNTASRLCSKGQSGKLTISKAIFDACGGTDRLMAGEEQWIKVKGKIEKISIYIVQQLNAEFQTRLSHQIQSMSQYLIEQHNKNLSLNKPRHV